MKIWCVYDTRPDPDMNEDEHWWGGYLTRETALEHMERAIQLCHNPHFNGGPTLNELAAYFRVEEYEVI